MANGTDIDWEGFDLDIERLVANEWDEEQVDHINELRDIDHGVRHEDPWLIELLNKKDSYKSYFSYTRNLMEETNMADKYTNYLKSNDKTGFKKLPENEEFAKLLKFADETKAGTRETDLELAELLMLLGKITTRTFADIEEKFLRQQQEQAQGVSQR